MSLKIVGEEQVMNSENSIAFDEIKRSKSREFEKEFDEEREELISFFGQTGIWLSKSLEENWSLQHPTLNLKDYTLNEDPNPEVIIKKRPSNHKSIEYTQDFVLRVLKPVTPPPPGDIIIKQEADVRPPAGPPLILRQKSQAARVVTPEPLVLREKPPAPPPLVPQKLITISGKRLPPPPRKLIIERMADLPPKPRPVVLERWLPYPKAQKRRVIFQPPSPNESSAHEQNIKNVIIEWEPNKCEIKVTFQDGKY